MIILFICALNGGCSFVDTMQDEEVFRKEFEYAVEHHDPELSISELRGIAHPDQDSAIKVQAAVTYLSLHDEATPFLPEAQKLSELTRDKALHELSSPVQVLLYLGYKADGDADKDVKAVRRIRHSIDRICGRSYFGLDRPIEDVNELNVRLFRKYVSPACLETIKDAPVSSLVRHAVIVSMLQSSEPCMSDFSAQSLPLSAVMAWFECRLNEEASVDLKFLLSARFGQGEIKFTKRDSDA